MRPSDSGASYPTFTFELGDEGDDDTIGNDLS